MNTHPTLLKHVWAKPDQDNENLAQNPFITRYLLEIFIIHGDGSAPQNGRIIPNKQPKTFYVFNNKKQFYWQTNHFNEYIRDKLSSSWARFLFRPTTQRFFAPGVVLLQGCTSSAGTVICIQEESSKLQVHGHLL